MGKWLDRINSKSNVHALNQGDRVDTVDITPASSTMSLPTSCVMNKISAINISKINELKSLIKKISVHYGGDDEHFLVEYIDDIILHNGIDALLACFRDLAKQIPSVNNRK